MGDSSGWWPTYKPGPRDAEGGDRQKRPELVDRRTDAHWLEEQFQSSQRRVCGLMSIAVSSFRCRSRRSHEDLKEKLARLAREKPRYGYRRLQVLMEREGERVN